MKTLAGAPEPPKLRVYLPDGTARLAWDWVAIEPMTPFQAPAGPARRWWSIRVWSEFDRAWSWVRIPQPRRIEIYTRQHDPRCECRDCQRHGRRRRGNPSPDFLAAGGAPASGGEGADGTPGSPLCPGAVGVTLGAIR